MSIKRKISYGDAINEAHRMALIRDPNCFVIGQGVNNPWFVGRTTVGLMEEFGPERIMDSPIRDGAGFKRTVGEFERADGTGLEGRIGGDRRRARIR